MRGRTWLGLTLILLIAGVGCAGGDAAGEGFYEPGTGSDTDTGSRSGDGSSAGPTEGGATGDYAGGGGSTGGEECPDPDGCTAPEEIPPGQLTAGEWRDLDHWDFWLGLMDSEEWADKQTHWGYETRNRVPVRVASGDYPVVDAQVELLDGSGAVVWQSRTDADGEAELFAGAFAEDEGPYDVRVSAYGETRTVEDVSIAWMEPVEVEMSEPYAPSSSLDLMFVIDTTGSMGDEIGYIQAELGDVVDRAQTQSAQRFDLRLSLNFYRDEGDEYVVRSHPFTTDVSEATGWLEGERASGGGDFPEAVDQALADAIDGHEWRESATARVMFLVLDAPPHHDEQILTRMRAATKAAAEHGVRIIPVAGSGIDKNTEFLLRFSAILTGGTYTFLTNDSGIGGDHIEPTIGSFEIEFLNDLLVRLIVDAVE